MGSLYKTEEELMKVFQESMMGKGRFGKTMGKKLRLAFGKKRGEYGEISETQIKELHKLNVKFSKAATSEVFTAELKEREREARRRLEEIEAANDKLRARKTELGRNITAKDAPLLLKTFKELVTKNDIAMKADKEFKEAGLNKGSIFTHDQGIHDRLDRIFPTTDSGRRAAAMLQAGIQRDIGGRGGGGGITSINTGGNVVSSPTTNYVNNGTAARRPIILQNVGSPF
jgi:hypothetical protein